MSRLTYLSLASVFLVASVGHVFAQGPQGPPNAPGGGRQGGPPGPPPAALDIATARKAMAAAEATAAAENVRVTIAVVDANGDLVMLTRLDGARGVAVTSAEGKARAAILFGVPTALVQDAIAAGQAISVKVTMPQLGGFEVTPVRGGIPIMKDGKVIGGIGAGGAAPNVDEKVAQAGADATK